MVMLDDTRGGLDASSLHRATSMDKSLAKKFRLLSCHRDTSKKLAQVSENISKMLKIVLFQEMCYF